MSNPRPSPLLRDIDSQAPIKVLARPHRRPVHAEVAKAYTQAAAVPAAAMPAPVPPQPAVAEERGYEAGYEAGLREGLKDAERQLDEEVQSRVRKLEALATTQHEEAEQQSAQRLAQLDTLLEGLQAAVSDRLAQLEPEAVAMAYDALCKLLGQRAGDERVLAALIQQAVRQLRGGTLLAVRLHPADLDALQAHLAGQSLAERYPAVRWEADPHAERGSCTLTSDRGSLDASLATQLDRLRSVWAEGAAP